MMMKEADILKGFEVFLPSLKDGLTEMDFAVGKGFFQAMGASEILDADVSVALDIRKRSSCYDLDFGFEGWIEVPCDRCLDPVRIPVDTDFRLVVKYGDPATDEGDEHLLTLPEEASVLDTAPTIYDTLMLEIPLRRVHAEGECNPEMEARLNSDTHND